MKSLCLVHLSDLHLQEEKQFGPKSLLRKLIDDIKTQIDEQNLGAPFIVISGDLSSHGELEEFKFVEKFLGDIKNDLNPVDMIFCPGNHDLKWKEYYETCNYKFMKDLLEHPNQDSIDAVEERFRTRERALFGVGMKNYYDFLKKNDKDYNTLCEEIGNDINPLYYVKHLDCERVRVNFVSLNSAYLFWEMLKDFGYIGKTQFTKAFEKCQENLTSDFNPYNIALFHHPFEFLAPAYQVDTERFLKSSCGVILTGHVHNLKIYSDLTANLTGESKRRPLVSCARCVYDKDEDPYVTPGYSILRLDFSDNKVSSLESLKENMIRLEKENGVGTSLSIL